MDKTVFIALMFAAERHANQIRKGKTALPYINHPIQVVATLVEIGDIQTPQILAAAFLHDVLEDTATTPAEIEVVFGKEILELVQECTDDKSLPKSERKRLQIVNAPHKSYGARLIKIADKFCNVRDVTRDPGIGWDIGRRREYLLWAIQVVNGLRGVNEALEQAFDLLAHEGLAALAVLDE
ncbi:MAG TPA: HD domain-containing protein [Anaerolineales bacterium]|nr:HD domain-containing protein [Anaerolineales bacterium]